MLTYSIGKMSELSGISPKMLRYFDKIGLLTPKERNEENGYRYYSRDQVFDVFLIKRLQGLGFSLGEIHELFEVNEPREYSRRISRKLDALDVEGEDLKRRYREGVILMKKLEVGNNLGATGTLVIPEDCQRGPQDPYFAV